MQSTCTDKLSLTAYSMGQNKGSSNKKKYVKYLLRSIDPIFDMILMYVMLTVIDPNFIKFELFVFELCLFFRSTQKIKFSSGSLHSNQVINATVSVSLMHYKPHLNIPPT